jgi:enoyl-CoA hydratase
MDKVYLERDGRVGRLVLNRPDKLNAMDSESLSLLDGICAELEADAELVAVVVVGAGRAFCAGADLSEVEASLDKPRQFRAFLDHWHAVLARFERLPVPTVAAVHGHALAGGFELLQVCDVVVLSHDARIGDQHARHGVFPGGGSTQRLVRQVGMRHAKWLLYSGEMIEPTRAVEIGLANVVVPPEELRDEVARYVAVLAERSPSLTAQIKRAVHHGSQMPLADGLLLERELSTSYMHTEDAAIGLAAMRAREAAVYPPRRVDP